jgi:uncharacterized protein YqjF (DUF2071 family)
MAALTAAVTAVLTAAVLVAGRIEAPSAGASHFQLRSSKMQTSAFLRAEWRHLLMLNFVVDPRVLQPLVPKETELDCFGGKTFLSVVGFQFLRTRLLGFPLPFHTNFEEVNLRFYVRRQSDEGWRRGVVFLRELVPRRAIAFVAKTFYGEPYSAVPMRHKIAWNDSKIQVEYAWRRNARWESIRATGRGSPREIEAGSEEEFVTEHYWGYTARQNFTSEYQVEHPRWKVWQGADATFDADISSLYGNDFVESLSGPPSSVFIADGSEVTVRFHSRIQSQPRDSRKTAASR